MRITAINVHQVDLPLHEGSYKWSGGNRVDVFDSTIVEIETDEGVTGLGEVCPLGPAYLPAYAEGARVGIAQLAPRLIGRDPTRPMEVARFMDAAMRGHPYVKSPIDMACWDAFGKATGQPVSALLGGHYGEALPLYRAISQEGAEAMAASCARHRAEGYARFQLKVGGDPDEDIARIHACAAEMAPGEVLIADANTGWSQRQALRVAAAVRDLDVHIEQPCATYEECLVVRRHTDRPFILDEVIDGFQPLLRALHDQAMDAVNLKISKVGGLSRARAMRDLCAATGIAMTIEDSWGGDIATAAIAHLAQSTPAETLLSVTDFNSYVTVSTATGAPRREAGRFAASEAPGLGVALRREVVGEPVARYA